MQGAARNPKLSAEWMLANGYVPHDARGELLSSWDSNVAQPGNEGYAAEVANLQRLLDSGQVAGVTAFNPSGKAGNVNQFNRYALGPDGTLTPGESLQQYERSAWTGFRDDVAKPAAAMVAAAYGLNGLTGLEGLGAGAAEGAVASGVAPGSAFSFAPLEAGAAAAGGGAGPVAAGAAGVGGTGMLSSLGSFGQIAGTGAQIIGGLGALNNLVNPPKAPDLVGAAQAQGEANRQTALEQMQMNRLDETTPLGSVRYGRVADASVPGGFRYTRDVNLSPEQQQLYSAETQNQLGMQQLAGRMQGDVASRLGQPFSFGDAQRGSIRGPQMEMAQDGPDPLGLRGPEGRDLGTAANYGGGVDRIAQAMYDQQMNLRRPDMERDVAGMDARLRGQGLMPGTEAYDAEMRKLRTSQGTMMNDLALRGVLAGGQEQSRLAGLDMGLDAQRFGQQQTGFTNQLNQIQTSLGNRLATVGQRNAAQQQQFGNEMQGIQLDNNNRTQRLQEALTQRQLPLQEFNALRTGAQPSMPQFGAPGQVGYQAPNIAGATQAQFGANADVRNGQTAGWQSLLNFGARLGAPTPGVAQP